MYPPWYLQSACADGALCQSRGAAGHLLKSDVLFAKQVQLKCISLVTTSEMVDHESLQQVLVVFM